MGTTSVATRFYQKGELMLSMISKENNSGNRSRKHKGYYELKTAFVYNDKTKLAKNLNSLRFENFPINHHRQSTETPEIVVYYLFAFMPEPGPGPRQPYRFTALAWPDFNRGERQVFVDR